MTSAMVVQGLLLEQLQPRTQVTVSEFTDTFEELLLIARKRITSMHNESNSANGPVEMIGVC